MSLFVAILLSLLLTVHGSTETETISAIDLPHIDEEVPVVTELTNEMKTQVKQLLTEQLGQEYSSEQLKQIVSEKVIELKRKAEEWSRKSDQTVANLQQLILTKSNQIKDTVNSNLSESSKEIGHLRVSLGIFARKVGISLTEESSKLKQQVDQTRSEAQRRIHGPCFGPSRETEKARKNLAENADKHKALIDDFVKETNQLIDSLSRRIGETFDTSASTLNQQAQELRIKIDETVAWCINELQKWKASVEKDIEATRDSLDQRETQFMAGLNDVITDETIVEFGEWVIGSERDFLEAMEAIDDGGLQLKRELELEVLSRDEVEIKEWMTNFNNNLKDLEQSFLSELTEIGNYIRKKIVDMAV